MFCNSKFFVIDKHTLVILFGVLASTSTGDNQCPQQLYAVYTIYNMLQTNNGAQ